MVEFASSSDFARMVDGEPSLLVVLPEGDDIVDKINELFKRAKSEMVNEGYTFNINLDGRRDGMGVPVAFIREKDYPSEEGDKDLIRFVPLGCDVQPVEGSEALNVEKLKWLCWQVWQAIMGQNDVLDNARAEVGSV